MKLRAAVLALLAALSLFLVLPGGIRCQNSQNSRAATRDNWNCRFNSDPVMCEPKKGYPAPRNPPTNKLHIRKLRISKWRQRPARLFSQTVMGSMWRRLILLHLYLNEFTGIGRAAFSQMPLLETLEFTGNKQLRTIERDAFAGLRYLKTLSFRHCTGLAPVFSCAKCAPHLPPPPHNSPFQSLTALTTLDLTGIGIGPGFDLGLFPPALPLHTIILDSNVIRRVCLPARKTAPTLQKNLQTLSLRGNPLRRCECSPTMLALSGWEKLAASDAVACSTHTAQEVAYRQLPATLARLCAALRHPQQIHTDFSDWPNSLRLACRAASHVAAKISWDYETAARDTKSVTAAQHDDDSKAVIVISGRQLSRMQRDNPNFAFNCSVEDVWRRTSSVSLTINMLNVSRRGAWPDHLLPSANSDSSGSNKRGGGGSSGDNALSDKRYSLMHLILAVCSTFLIALVVMLVFWFVQWHRKKQHRKKLLVKQAYSAYEPHIGESGAPNNPHQHSQLHQRHLQANNNNNHNNNHHHQLQQHQHTPQLAPLGYNYFNSNAMSAADLNNISSTQSNVVASSSAASKAPLLANLSQMNAQRGGITNNRGIVGVASPPPSSSASHTNTSLAEAYMLYGNSNSITTPKMGLVSYMASPTASDHYDVPQDSLISLANRSIASAAESAAADSSFIGGNFQSSANNDDDNNNNNCQNIL